VNLKGISKIIAALLLTAAASGCGDGNSESNGTLTLTPAPGFPLVNAGVVSMSATALLTPIQVGSEITFSMQLFNADGAIPLPANCSGTKNTDVTGTATISCNFLQPAADSTLQISAKSSGLTAIPVTIPFVGL